MINMKCELCGVVWAKDDSYKGMEIRCPNCQGRCKCLSDRELESVQLECPECGLACPVGTEKCPACGSEISVRQKAPQQADDSTSQQDFLKSWEKNLGGHSFSVIVSLTVTIIATVFSCLSLPWSEIRSSSLLWLVRIEMIASSILSFCAAILLCLFFRHSQLLFKWLPSYFKIRGFVVIADFIGLILLDEMVSSSLSAQIDIKPVIMGAFWCFFWAWYFKRVFRMKA